MRKVEGTVVCRMKMKNCVEEEQTKEKVMNRKNKAGFTLVELMVVAIIVAILAAVAIPLMSANKKRSMFTEGEAGLGHMRTAERVYQAEHGTYMNITKTDMSLASPAVPGIGPTDLDGKYFQTKDYSMVSTPSNYTLKVTGSTGDVASLWVELNEAGVFTRSAGL